MLKSDKCWLAPVARLTGGDTGNWQCADIWRDEGDFTASPDL